MIFTPFAFVKSEVTAGPVIPTSGLVGWWDASDYTSGATWSSRVGVNLNLAGTYSKDNSTLGGPSIFFNGGDASNASLATSAFTSNTEFTQIELLRTTVTGPGLGSFNISGTNTISGYQFGTANSIVTWKNGDTGWRLTSRSYGTTKTTFVARRVITGYNNTTTPLQVSYGDNAGVSLTHYGAGNFSLERAGTTTYTLGASVGYQIGSAEAGLYRLSGRYVTNLIYSRRLTDSEIQQVYDYYKSTYSLS
jgi:hypothetical protein